jgi:RNA polymerase sigma-70 factor (ECF subfamily)
MLGFIPGRVRPIDDELDLAHAVSRLSGRQRLAVDCFYFVGLGVTETAAVMGCSEGTVKSTLSDARRRLRNLLEGRDGPA